MNYFFKILNILAICVAIIGGPANRVQADGFDDLVRKLCHEYPSWLAANYPDPSPKLYNPINISVTSESLNLTGTFTEYQMFGHGNPENWECTRVYGNLTSGNLEMRFSIWGTKFGGKYQLEGEGTHGQVRGQGTWNISPKDSSAYTTFVNFYEGVHVTPDNFVDLTTARVISVYVYNPQGQNPTVREMNGLIAGADEVTVMNKAFERLESLTIFDEVEHPLRIPLRTYLQLSFARTPIPSEM